MRLVMLLAISAALGIGLGVVTGFWEYGPRLETISLDVAPPASPEDPALVVEPPEISPEGPQPQVQVDQEKFDFGLVQSGSKQQHDFVISNVGQAPLLLKIASTTCKCTVGELSDGTIPPGKSTKVTLTWNAEGSDGAYRQSARLLTNDPLRQQFELEVEGRITRGVSLEPQELVLGSVHSSEGTGFRFRVYSSISTGFKIQGCQLAAPELEKFFAFTWQPLAKDELALARATSGYQVQAEVKPGLPYGPLRQKILLFTDLPQHPRLELPLTGTVTTDIAVLGPDYSTTQGLLRLGKIRRTEGASRDLKLVTRGPHRGEIQFQVLQVDPPELKVELGTRSEINNGTVTVVPLTVRVPPGTRSLNRLGTNQGQLAEIHLQTNHPDVPVLKVLVQMVIED